MMFPIKAKLHLPANMGLWNYKFVVYGIFLLQNELLKFNNVSSCTSIEVKPVFLNIYSL